MKAVCSVKRLSNGQWLARHSGSQFGTVEITAAGREEVLKRLRDELQYRIELCPCSGVSGDRVELAVEERD